MKLENGGLFRTEVVRGYSDRALENILLLEKACFPKEWQYDDARKYYSDRLRDERAVKIFVFAGDTVAGFLLAYPLSGVYDELKGSRDDGKDEDIENDPRCLYIETASVLPAYKGGFVFVRLLKSLQEEVIRTGNYNSISCHARTVNSTDRIIERLFPVISEESRDIDRWHFGGGEFYRYLMWRI